MQPLNVQTLNNINEFSVPNYRTADNKPESGIVHLGPGAFFRGHQAWYTHQVMQKLGGDWGITCVSMRSTGVCDALSPQDGLYTLAVLDAQTSYEILGSINEVFVAGSHHQQILDKLTSPACKLVSMTITEKGYCLNNKGELDLDNVEIKQDLSANNQPVTAIGLLISALAIRKNQGLKPFTVLSCDNLTDNGKKLKAAIVKFANQVDESLALWLDDNLISPCTMVDSITPATDDALRAQVQDKLAIQDNWPIKREAFVQWVIEDTLPADCPKWSEVGATLTSDVRGFENAKLRLLNCPHSTLAYLGVLAGIETVYDAMQNPELVSLIQQLIKTEIIPSFVAPKELDVNAYSQAILDRFRNPAIRHLLSQIAWDGSQKLPMRIIPIVEHNVKAGISIDYLSVALAAWCLFCRKRFIEQETLVDPLADQLFEIAQNCVDDANKDVKQFLTLEAVFPPELAKNEKFVSSLTNAYQVLLPTLRDANALDLTQLLPQTAEV
ncbi:mannitol dehydrogenase family protein [Catenovulum sediminis]|uniref:mannitol dehydrogenase family protein n=1 Tax=Catenovulum sediminis TaxID=1740262 RepID=UPI00117C858A|nr:mannitol dehydrogenase family protein [Catenovulum sediminis]